MEGRLHRAVSVLIYNSEGELLLQQRAAGKYHSANLWTNTCCSHPRPGETAGHAAERRLREEMGLNCELKEAFSFIYKAHLDSGLTEYELDHVFTGICDMVPVPDPMEASAWKFVSMAHLKTDMEANPEQYTEWFKILIKRVPGGI